MSQMTNDLARAPSTSRRRRVATTLLIAALLCSNLYFAVHKWFPILPAQLELFWLQRQCASFDVGAGNVIFESNQMEAASLLEQRGYQRIRPDYFDVEDEERDQLSLADEELPVVAVSGAKELWTQYDWAADRVVSLKTPNNGLFGGGLFGGGVSYGDVCFLHRRRSPAGHERIVVIEFEWRKDEVEFYSTVVVPGSWTAVPKIMSGSTSFAIEAAPFTDGFFVRLYGGRADAGDESRFTIDYVTPSGSGTIAGRLRDDDTVTMSFAAGPGAPAVEEDETPEYEVEYWLQETKGKLRAGE